MRRLRELLLALRESFWLLPGIALVLSVLLGIAMVEVGSVDLDLELAARWPRLFGAGAEGTRGTLAAIAGSMITVAGVVFSVTIVALSLAADAYSPRVLRTFATTSPSGLAGSTTSAATSACGWNGSATPTSAAAGSAA